MAPTLKQLEAFYWAATSPSFAVAADKIHISVSSLSKRICELETSLDQTLFVRMGNRAELSDAGHYLVPRVRGLLSSTETLISDMRRTDDMKGLCRVGAGELTALTWLSRYLAHLKLEHPKLGLEAIVTVGGELEARLAAGELDIAIVAGASSRPAIASDPIAKASFGWFSATRADAREDFVTQALLDGYPLVSLPVGSGATRLVDSWLREHGLTAAERINCNNWHTVAGLITEGAAVGVLPLGLVASSAMKPLLRRLNCAKPLPSLEYFVQWRSDDYRQLVTALRAVATRFANFDGQAS